MPYRWTEEDVRKAMAYRVPTALPTAPTVQVKRPKYRNRKVTDAKGGVHDSTKEFRHWQALQLRERAGEIRNLRRHVPIACVVNDVHICDYEADAMYEEGAATIVIDAKSPVTRKLPAYRLKLKLLQALHKLQIREV